MQIALVVGTRPEIIKMSPVIKALKKRNVEFCFVLTGQHYDYEMSMQFVAELSLPSPTTRFRLENSNPASQIGEMMVKLEPVLKHAGSRILLIQGDTNSMLAAALTGLKLGIRVAHVEAGLRSYDWRMPEEHNRRMVDHVSNLLFAPTETSKQNLLSEHVHGKILVTGNTVVDAALDYLHVSKGSEIMGNIPFQEFCLTTIHRKENVDSAETLGGIVDVLVAMEIPVVFPVHPRTDFQLRKFGFYERLSSAPHICLLPPIGYVDTLVLMKNSKLILTDSGGLQEEATVPGITKPVILLRRSTERPEAVEAGFTKVTGLDKGAVLRAISGLLGSPPALPERSPFGDGNAANRIVDSVLQDLA